MHREVKGGECEFDKTIDSNLRLFPNAFGGRKTFGNEKYCHSHPGEALAAMWDILKNRHYIWGVDFSLISDCRALRWLQNFDEDNKAIIHL